LNGRAIDIAGDARTMPDTARVIAGAAGKWNSSRSRSRRSGRPARTTH
jgi:hypothetical protein